MNEKKEDCYRNMERLIAEKDAIQERIREIEENRDQIQRQLNILKRDINSCLHEVTSPVVLSVLLGLIRHPVTMKLFIKETPSRTIKEHLQVVFSGFSEEKINELQKEGIINDKREPTTAGIVMLRTIYLNLV